MLIYEITILNWEKYQGEGKKWDHPTWFRFSNQLCDHILWDITSGDEFKAFYAILAEVSRYAHRSGTRIIILEQLARIRKVQTAVLLSVMKKLASQAVQFIAIRQVPPSELGLEPESDSTKNVTPTPKALGVGAESHSQAHSDFTPSVNGAGLESDSESNRSTTPSEAGAAVESHSVSTPSEKVATVRNVTVHNETLRNETKQKKSVVVVGDRDRARDQDQDQDDDNDAFVKGPGKKTRSLRGPVKELAGTKASDKLLAEVSQDKQRLWVESYGLDFVKAQIPRAYTKWFSSSDEYRKQRELTTWIYNFLEFARKQEPPKPDALSPPKAAPIEREILPPLQESLSDYELQLEEAKKQHKDEFIIATLVKRVAEAKQKLEKRP